MYGRGERWRTTRAKKWVGKGREGEENSNRVKEDEGKRRGRERGIIITS